MGPVLITGGAGFIGRRLVAQLVDRGWPVRLVDDLSVARDFPAWPGVDCQHLDIRDPAAMATACADVEAVVHLAALHHIPTCRAEPRRAVDINIVGTQTVLDAMPRGRVVLASTGAVYAWQDGPLGEDAPLDPSDIYAVTKATNERQAALWAEQPQRSLRIARIFNVIGPGDPNGHLIPDVLNRLAAAPTDGSALALKVGNLAPRRDVIDVEDVASGLVHLLSDADGPDAPTVYNLCSGREVDVRTLIETLAACRGIPVRLTPDPALMRSGDRPSQWGNPERMAERFGWRATRSLADSLTAIVRAGG